jgi:hypothetical protein
MVERSHIFQTIFHGGDDPKTFVDLSDQEKTNVRSDLGTLEIYHDGSVKIQPDFPFPAFPTNEHFYTPDLHILFSLYQLVPCNIIFYV